MAELKKKVTLKRKSDIITKPPEPIKGKKKLIVPLFIIGFLIVLAGGYFLLKPGSSAEPKTTKDEQNLAPVKNDITPASNVAAPEQKEIAKNETTSKPEEKKVAVEANKPDQQPVTQATSPGKVQETKSTPEWPYKKGESYKIYLFPFGKYNYSNPDPELDKLVNAMKTNTGMNISIFAYTDNVGSDEFNLALSDMRAEAIQSYLISKGIKADRITHQGKGISKKYQTASENRRAEFILSN